MKRQQFILSLLLSSSLSAADHRPDAPAHHEAHVPITEPAAVAHRYFPGLMRTYAYSPFNAAQNRSQLVIDAFTAVPAERRSLVAGQICAELGHGFLFAGDLAEKIRAIGTPNDATVIAKNFFPWIMGIAAPARSRIITRAINVIPEADRIRIVARAATFMADQHVRLYTAGRIARYIRGCTSNFDNPTQSSVFIAEAYCPGFMTGALPHRKKLILDALESVPAEHRESAIKLALRCMKGVTTCYKLAQNIYFAHFCPSLLTNHTQSSDKLIKQLGKTHTQLLPNILRALHSFISLRRYNDYEIDWFYDSFEGLLFSFNWTNTENKLLANWQIRVEEFENIVSLVGRTFDDPFVRKTLITPEGYMGIVSIHVERRQNILQVLQRLNNLRVGDRGDLIRLNLNYTISLLNNALNRHGANFEAVCDRAFAEAQRRYAVLDGRIRFLDVLGPLLQLRLDQPLPPPPAAPARPAAPPPRADDAAYGTDVHARQRDQKTAQAIGLLINEQGALRTDDIFREIGDLERYILESADFSEPKKAKIRRALCGPKSPADYFGPLLPDDTFSIHGFYIPGKAITVRLWLFAKSYVRDEDDAEVTTAFQKFLKDDLLNAMLNCYEQSGSMVCNPGKVQRMVIAVLQGQLEGANIDEVAIPGRAELAARMISGKQLADAYLKTVQTKRHIRLKSVLRADAAAWFAAQPAEHAAKRAIFDRRVEEYIGQSALRDDGVPVPVAGKGLDVFHAYMRALGARAFTTQEEAKMHAMNWLSRQDEESQDAEDDFMQALQQGLDARGIPEYLDDEDLAEYVVVPGGAAGVAAGGL